jgi:hypothetical protein
MCVSRNKVPFKPSRPTAYRATAKNKKTPVIGMSFSGSGWNHGGAPAGLFKSWTVWLDSDPDSDRHGGAYLM